MVNKILAKIKEYSICKPDETVCRFLNDNISYGEFEKDTNTMAQKISLIIKNRKQIPIIIYHKRGIQFIKYMIAVLKCQCFYIPLESSMPIERVKYIYNDINAALILTDMQDSFESDYNATSLEEDIDYTIDSFSADELIDEKDLVYVMYTSGTSGKPKGVKIRYLNLMNLVDSFYDIVYKRFTTNISVGVLASFSFDASVKQIFCALYYGHTLCIADDSDKIISRKLHNFHVKYNLTICDSTPSHISFMTMQKTKSISKIPYMVIGGEILRWETLHKYIAFTCHDETTFINVYGPTECCVDVAYKIITKEDLDTHLNGLVPIGKSINNTILTVRSEDNTIIDQCGIQGELFVAGRQVGAGYVNEEADTFVNDGDGIIYKTGDIAFINCDHEFVVIGRKDSQVKVNGYRIELSEIQVAIGKYLKTDCAIFCINQNTRGDKKIVTYICKVDFKNSDKDDLITHLKEILPVYMVPNYFFSGETMPLTTNGKIAEEKLREMFYDSIKEMPHNPIL